MSESFSTETPVGRATIGLLAVFAQLERETIRERLLTGRTARAKAGLYHGGGPSPVGYRFEDGRLVVDPEEAETVREIFRLYDSGLSIRQVRDSLIDRGVTFRGLPWNIYHVKTVLKNPLYVGQVRFGGKVYAGDHEPLVDREIFDRVNGLLVDRARAFGQDRAAMYAGDRILLGVAFCAKCGSRLTPTTSIKKGKTYCYYVCTASRDRAAARARGISCSAKPIRKEKLEGAVLDEISKLSLDPSFVPAPKKEKPDPRPGLADQIEKIDRQISRLIDLYASGEFSADVLSEKASSLRETRQKLESRLEMIDAEKSSSTAQNAKKALSGFSDAVKAGDPSQLKMIVRELIDWVEYADDSLVIRWKFE